MNYDDFEKHMKEKYPRYFGEGKQYGGFAIGEGWYHIIESLIANIHHYTKHKRSMRARDLLKVRAKKKGLEAMIDFMAGKRASPSDWDIERAEEAMQNEIEVTPKLNWIEVQQIKEKFGGLRFYYQGGDEHISGIESMAESWAYRTCETCGNKGERRSGGWIRTLCDAHEAEYQERLKERK
jgi:hypothetical protein